MTKSTNLAADSFKCFAAWLAALFLVALGAKLWVIQLYGSALPFWDQWDEARLFIKPWLEGRATWSAWFAAHNEHRIFFTRLLDVLFLWLNRQWDPLLQMVVNAVIHSGYACGLAYALWRFTGRKYGGLICFLLMPFFALPFAAENTLHGFQSQMYFLGIFAVVTIIGLGFSSPGGGWWWAGLVAAFLSIFTMASGFLAAVAVGGLMVLRMVKARGITRPQLVTIACCLAVVVVGLALNVTIAGHEKLRPGSPIMFLGALMSFLAWPFGDQSMMLWFICLPLLITGILYFQSTWKNPPAAELILTLAFWSFLQTAALAYGRGHLNLSSRYLDTTCTTLIASLASLFVLKENLEYRKLSRPFLMALATVWVGMMFWGMWQTSQYAMSTKADTAQDHYMPANRRWSLREEDNVRAFIATGDTGRLANQKILAIPYSDASGLASLLLDPHLMAIMPAVCRPPLKLEKDGESDASFVPDGYPPDVPAQPFTRAWGNFSTNELKAPSTFVSQPLSATLPKLVLPLGCGTNPGGIRLQLVEQQTGRTIELHPETAGRWHTLIIDAPRSPFRLKITDPNQHSWVAVGDIQESGRLSYYALVLLNHAVTVLLAGLGLCVFLAGSAVVRRAISPGGGAFVELPVALIGLLILVFVWSGRNFDVTELNIKLRISLALGFTQNGNRPEAEMNLRNVLWLQPDNPETFVMLANVILEDPAWEPNRAREQAVVYYQAALRLRPDYVEARQQLDKMLQVPGRPGTTAN